MEKLGCLECGVVGGIYSPNHQTSRLVVADCRMSHRTVRCTPDMSGAPATSPGCWDSTVGASDFWVRLAIRCTPDKYCRLSGAPSPVCLTSARFWRALNAPAGDRWREVVKGKCALGPFLSILVIKCQHKCLNVNLWPWMNKVQITSKRYVSKP